MKTKRELKKEKTKAERCMDKAYTKFYKAHIEAKDEHDNYIIAKYERHKALVEYKKASDRYYRLVGEINFRYMVD